MSRQDDIREQALRELQRQHVLMLDGHFDFGNGFHGAVYLNPHQLFRYPATIWRFAQDLIAVLPSQVIDATEVVAGPATGGALLAFSIAGLLDSRRAISGAPMLFAPFGVAAAPDRSHTLSEFYGAQVRGRRVLLVDDVRNTGQTFAHCAALVKEAGGTVVATAEIYDRLEAVFDPGVENFALAGYKAPPNYPERECPLCLAGQPITTF